ncbi:flagellar biosynthetic protein FliR [Anaerosacchariphilus polymeriproducens]|uniref:Flagellar biosynthetic protein FliR n=1 Tax=Anaerosacchariphilus polymeriproducens TaxID=1812858 RepID=A0A371AS74_9FIRM|nr:flagellar biosynthetic protein FliR [Anaerosacchariphilus polymeriproducens]RDU22418.1 flagellar biosynthetic protein FliR [Anaerosacchariphilus polymeriproducens]
MVNYVFSIETFEYFLVIFVRMATFVFIAPFFGMSNTPARVKVGFSLVVSIVLFQVLPVKELNYNTAIEYGVIVLKEGITGLLIGYAASICNSIVIFAGKIIDMDMGLSMATLFDPVTKEQTSITGNLYSYFVLMMLIVSNMHHYILRALVDSYQLIPVDGLNINVDKMYSNFSTFMIDFIVIGFRIALPVFACILIMNVILGILAKVAPQLNMFAVGIQMKIMVGLMVLFLTIGLLPSISNFIFEEIKKMIILFIEGMH